MQFNEASREREADAEAASPGSSSAERTCPSPATAHAIDVPVNSDRASSLPDIPVARATITGEKRQQMIAAAAYRRYEQRGGASSDPVNDWLEAEKEVDMALSDVEAHTHARKAFLSKLSSGLAECQAQIEELGARAIAANTAMKRMYEEQVAVLTPKYEAARAKLVEIGEQTDDAWGHLREGAEKAANEMRAAVRQAVSVFR